MSGKLKTHGRRSKSKDFQSWQSNVRVCEILQQAPNGRRLRHGGRARRWGGACRKRRPKNGSWFSKPHLTNERDCEDREVCHHFSAAMSAVHPSVDRLKHCNSAGGSNHRQAGQCWQSIQEAVGSRRDATIGGRTDADKCGVGDGTNSESGWRKAQRTPGCRQGLETGTTMNELYYLPGRAVQEKRTLGKAHRSSLASCPSTSASARAHARRLCHQPRKAHGSMRSARESANVSVREKGNVRERECEVNLWVSE